MVGHYRISVGVSEADVHPGDLSGYAASRGLDFRSQALQLGYLGAFPWAEELMFNVMRACCREGRVSSSTRSSCSMRGRAATGQDP